VSSADAERIAAIYNYYVAHSVITFEEESVSAPGRLVQVLVNLGADRRHTAAAGSNITW